jgi:hypothetical protein
MYLTIMVLWDVIMCRLGYMYQHFGRTYCFHLCVARSRNIYTSSAILKPFHSKQALLWRFDVAGTNIM